MVVVSVLRIVLPSARAGRLAPSALSGTAAHLHAAALLLAQVRCHPEYALSFLAPFLSPPCISAWARGAEEEDAAVVSGTPLSSVLSTERGMCVCVRQREKGREGESWLLVDTRHVLCLVRRQQ